MMRLVIALSAILSLASVAQGSTYNILDFYSDCDSSLTLGVCRNYIVYGLVDAASLFYCINSKLSGGDYLSVQNQLNLAQQQVELIQINAGDDAWDVCVDSRSSQLEMTFDLMKSSGLDTVENMPDESFFSGEANDKYVKDDPKPFKLQDATDVVDEQTIRQKVISEEFFVVGILRKDNRIIWNDFTLGRWPTNPSGHGPEGGAGPPGGGHGVPTDRVGGRRQGQRAAVDLPHGHEQELVPRRQHSGGAGLGPDRRVQVPQLCLDLADLIIRMHVRGRLEAQVLLVPENAEELLLELGQVDVLGVLQLVEPLQTQSPVDLGHALALSEVVFKHE